MTKTCTTIACMALSLLSGCEPTYINCKETEVTQKCVCNGGMCRCMMETGTVIETSIALLEGERVCKGCIKRWKPSEVPEGWVRWYWGENNLYSAGVNLGVCPE